MRLRFRLPTHPILISVSALIAVFLLSLTPIGSLYQTMLGYSEEERVAEVLIAGLTKPKVEVVIGDAPSGMSVIMKIEETNEAREDKELTLTIPQGWNLSEVSGVHARKVVSYPLEHKRTMLMPLENEVELKFIVDIPFKMLSFSHTGDSPALVSLTHIILPEKIVQNEVQLVDGGVVFVMPTL
jgi:hypothetical protein